MRKIEELNEQIEFLREKVEQLTREEMHLSKRLEERRKEVEHQFDMLRLAQSDEQYDAIQVEIVNREIINANKDINRLKMKKFDLEQEEKKNEKL